jgi:ribosome maturation protein Sdo1
MTVDELTREEKLIDLRDDVALEEVLKDMERGRDASQEER